MTLREKQSIFAKNIAKLILHAYDLGYELTVGEFLRTKDQQALYFLGYNISVIDGKINLSKGKKRSKTLNSSHLKKLAADLNLFIDGKYRTDRESYKSLADYWKSLNENNVAGYDWGFDANHFEMK